MAGTSSTGCLPKLISRLRDSTSGNAGTTEVPDNREARTGGKEQEEPTATAEALSAKRRRRRTCGEREEENDRPRRRPDRWPAPPRGCTAGKEPA